MRKRVLAVLIMMLYCSLSIWCGSQATDFALFGRERGRRSAASGSYASLFDSLRSVELGQGVCGDCGGASEASGASGPYACCPVARLAAAALSYCCYYYCYCCSLLAACGALHFVARDYSSVAN